MTHVGFDNDVIRRVNYADDLCGELRGLMTKAGCSRFYMKRIENRVLRAMMDTGYLDPACIQGELSRKAISELREKLNPHKLQRER